MGPTVSWVLLVTLFCALDLVASVLYEERPEPCANVETSGFVADPDDPGSYYYCHSTGVGVKVTCTPDGYLWNREQQMCMPPIYNQATLTCAVQLGEIANGTWSCPHNESLPLGSRCTLTCSPGNRVMNGAATSPLQQYLGATIDVRCNRVTNSPARWSHDVTELACVTVCTPNRCGFGDCSLVDQEAVCTCYDGFELDADGTGLCLTESNGCLTTNCGPNGYCIGRGTCVCDAGFEGEFCNNQTSCPNPDILDVANGRLDTNGVTSFLYNTSVTISCNEGYKFKADNFSNTGSLTCNRDGVFANEDGKEFNANDQVCELIDCGTPNIASGTVVVAGNTTFNGTGEVTCLPGYEKSSEVFQCQADGQWGPARCEPVDCGAFPVPSNGEVGSGTTMFEDVLTITCSSGYVLNGTTNVTSQTVECTAGGWSEFPGCVVTSCQDLSTFVAAVSAAAVNWTFEDQGGDNQYGAKVQLSCPPSYMLIGGDDAGKLTCGYEGWTPTLHSPSCRELICDTAFAATFANGTATVSGNGTAGTTTANVVCDDGYVVDIDTTPSTVDFTCTETTPGVKVEWMPKLAGGALVPSCKRRSCPTLVQSPGGSYAGPVSNGVYQDTVTLTCDEGYQSSSDTITCDATGNWTPNITCERVACPVITLANGNFVASDGNSIGSNITFSCGSGFSLNVEPNYAVTCLSNGQYSNALPTCINADDCREVDCGNGNCQDGINTYSCICNAGWRNNVTNDTTSSCSRYFNPCETNPCDNFGECHLNNDWNPDSNQYEYYCQCTDARYTGYNCQKDNQVTPTQADCKAGAGPDEKQPHPGSCRHYITCGPTFVGVQPQPCSAANDLVFDLTTKQCTTPIAADALSLCTRNYS